MIEPKLPVTGTQLPEDKLDEPRDDQEGGSVGMESERGSEMNRKLASTREYSRGQYFHSRVQYLHRSCQTGSEILEVPGP